MAGLLDPEFMTRLERLQLVVRRLASGRMRGEKRSRRRGTGIEFADHRDYAEGDDPRFIDWNVLGRLDRLFLKLFHEEEDLHLSIWIDASASMGFGDPPKLLHAKRLAAALAYIALCNMDRVTLEGSSTGRVEILPGLRGKPALARVVEFLEALEPGGETDLETGLKRFALRNPEPGMRVAISDLLDKRGPTEPLRWLVRGHAEPVVAHVLAPEEIEPDLAGDITLVDLEDGERVEVSITGALMRAYGERVRGLRQGAEDWCRSRGVTYLFARTDVPVERILLRTLRIAGVIQ